MKKIRVSSLIIALLLPVIVGMISSALASKGMDAYSTMDKPPLSPPAWVFPVAWTILYLMMGLASYYVAVAEVNLRDQLLALMFYVLQLAMNFMWSIIFFNWEQYLFAFIWLAIMWGIVVLCVIRFYSISKVASLLMVPYVAWLTFAGYLNWGSYMLSINKR